MSRGTRIRRRRVAAVAMCLAAIFAVGACGGDDEEPATTAAEETTAPEEQEAAVEQTLVDFGSSEGVAGCDFFTEGYIEQLGGASGCEKEFEEAVAADYDVTDVSVSGETARADVETDGQKVFFELELVDGEWKIAEPPI